MASDVIGALERAIGQIELTEFTSAARKAEFKEQAAVLQELKALLKDLIEVAETCIASGDKPRAAYEFAFEQVAGDFARLCLSRHPSGPEG